MAHPQIELTVRVYGDAGGRWQAIAEVLAQAGYTARQPGEGVSLGECDVLLFLGWGEQAATVRQLEDAVTQHGSWNYLGSVAVGEPSHRWLAQTIHQIGPSRYLTANAPPEQVAAAILHTFNASQWSCERRGALPAFIVNTEDGRIVRANDSARRVFGDQLVGLQYLHAVEDLTAATFAFDHPIRRAVVELAPQVEDREWQRPAVAGGRETFSCFLLCHPIITPRKATSAMVWVVDRRGAAAVSRAMDDLFKPTDTPELYRLLVKTAAQLGFTASRLYRFNRERQAYYAKAAGGDAKVLSELLKGRAGEPESGFKWSVVPGDDYDDVSAVIRAERMPLLIVPNADVDVGRVHGRSYKFPGTARPVPGLDPPHLGDRWIEAPLWVIGADGVMPADPWGKLSLRRQPGADSLTEYDLRDVEVFSRVAATAIAAHERAAEARDSLTRIQECSPLIADCLRNEFRELFRRYPEIEAAVRKPPELFDVAIAKVLHIYLAATGGDIALYRQQDPLHVHRLQRIGPILRRDGFHAETASPPNEWRLFPPILDCFPFFGQPNPPAAPHRVSDPKGVLDAYLTIQGQPRGEAEREYLELIEDELQIPVFEGQQVRGAVVVVSDKKGKFANPPPIVSHLIPVVSIWLDLARRTAGRVWADRTTDRLVRLLPKLDAVPPDDDPTWFLAAVTLLSARGGLQWNRVFLWDCAATSRPFTARLVYALGGLCEADGHTAAHRALQHSLPEDTSDAALTALLDARIADRTPHHTDAAGRPHTDELYAHFFGPTAHPAPEVSYSPYDPPADGDNPIGDLLRRAADDPAADLDHLTLELGGRGWLNELQAEFERRAPDSPARLFRDLPAGDQGGGPMRLFAFPLVSPLSPDRQPLGVVLVEMLMPNEHPEGDRLTATRVFLRLLSDLLAIRRLRRRWSAWVRNLPVVYHDNRSLKAVCDRVESRQRAILAGPSPDPAAVADYQKHFTDLRGRIHSLYASDANSRAGCTIRQVADALRTDFPRPTPGGGKPDLFRLDVNDMLAPPDARLPCPLDVLQRIIKSLTENTRKAYREHHRPLPCLARVWFECHPAPNGPFAGYVEVHYEDDGPGLPEGERMFVFLDGYTTTGEVGRGQGLALARAMLIANSGDIRATDPVSGSGAHFALLFGQPKPQP